MTVPTLFALSSVGLSGPVSAQDAVDREELKKLAAAAAERDLDGYLRSFRELLGSPTSKVVGAALASYEKVAAVTISKEGVGEFVWLHGKAAGAFARIEREGAATEARILLEKSKSWHVRLLVLDGALFTKSLSLLDTALTALKDPEPIVVRRALFYLRRAKRVEVVDQIIRRYEDLTKARPRNMDEGPWTRTLLTFQSSLREMLGVDLAVAADYRNYFESRRGSSLLFDPPKGGEVTGLTLFGAAVTGKNIIFILDTSGSMLTEDPRPPGDDGSDPDRGRTVVGEPSRDPEALLRPSDRQRMFRAKKELAKVFRALPSDISFNLITYATEVVPWQKSLVRASDENKKGAVAYIEGMNAEGITVTDLAIEEAFTDLEVDTIYLVTDGAPTHVGQELGERRPRDADRIIGAIHERVKEINFLRGVRIFTLGFLEADEEFLKKLAADNAGAFYPIR